MSLKIVFTPEARDTLNSIILFIRSKWGNKSADKFKSSAIKTVQTISTQPYMFKAVALSRTVRKGFISKQTSVFYEVQETHILVLYFWDNRQDPILLD